MSDVYIVIEHDYTAAYIRGVYRTLEAARTRVDGANDETANNMTIEQHVLDSGAGPKNDWTKHFYSMDLEPLWSDDPTREQQENAARDRTRERSL